MSTTHKPLTREEVKKRCQQVASVIPGATVRSRAWNITVISRTGKHLVSWIGSKEGFTRA